MKCHCREAHCRQSPTSCTSKPIATPNTPHYHTQIYTLWMFSHPHHLWRKCAKATSQLDCIHRRSALQGGAKAQGYALCLSPEAHRATKNISTIALPTSRDCRAKAAATAPQCVHGNQCGLTTNRHSQRCAQAHKKPPHARQRKPMRKTAKWLDCPKGWAWENGLLLNLLYCISFDWGKVIKKFI